MIYPFWINDFRRTKNHDKEYPNAHKIFEYPVAFWYGKKKYKKERNWGDSISRLLRRAYPCLPVIVLYNLPDRDLGSYSSGGAYGAEEYLSYIEDIAIAINSHNVKPMIILEPDALPHCTEIEEVGRQEYRLALLTEALKILKTVCESPVYVDIGHSGWLEPKKAAELLLRVGAKKFSVNVSNYRTTEESMEWADMISEYMGGATYVVDTSRNGNGPLESEWCNPPGRALGHPPTTDTGNENCDAFLWIKVPGESDGKCNGGPPAGMFWGAQAEELVNNARWIK